MCKTKTIVCLTILLFYNVNSKNSAINQYYASTYLQEEFGTLQEYLSERHKILSNPFRARTTQSNSYNDQGNFRGATNINDDDDDYDRDLSAIQRNPFYQEIKRNTEPTVLIDSPKPVFHHRQNVAKVPKTLLPEYDDNCGMMDRQPTVTHLIANANTATRHYPWLVAIKNGSTFICGGTLISKNHMVSAAHCLNASRLAEYNFLITNNLTSNDIIRKAKKIDNHSGYLPDHANADISVVLFDQEVPLGDHIKPICLWRDGYKNFQEITRQDEKGLLIAWGADETNQVSKSLPKEAFLPIIEFKDCRHRFNATSVSVLGPQTFCVGYKEGTGACRGDSGSGIMIRRNDRWYLRGVVSLSIFKDKNICETMEYTVVTDVAKYSHWIRSAIEEN